MEGRAHKQESEQATERVTGLGKLGGGVGKESVEGRGKED